MKTKIYCLFFAIMASIGSLWAYSFRNNGLGYDIISGTKNVELVYVDNSNRTTVDIPSSVKNGETYTVVSIGKAAFDNCKNSLISVSIPNSVTNIGDAAFKGCISLTSISFPNSITSIGMNIFDGCRSLNTLVYNRHLFVFMPSSYSGEYNIPDSIESIASWAFLNCPNLTSITIPNSVISIGNRAFNSCDNLTSVTIGNSVTSIGDYAFYFCTNLAYVYCESAAPAPISNNTFPATATIYVPQCADTTYQNAPYWKNLTIVPIQINTQVANNVGGVVTEVCGSMEIEAIPFEGYHFKKWLDGNADNPRRYSLSQSNLNFIAQFEINKYTISLNCDANQGSVTGDKGKFEHGSDHTIEAVPNYGYHFTQWSDGETENPRTFVLEQDTTFIALFAQNATFNITIASFDETQGVVTGSGEYYYGEIVTLTAIPNKGYYFDSWSDELTDNPRELKVTSDLELSPLFKECKEIVTSLNEVIVKGSSYDFGGQTYTQKGTYRDTIVLENGCDSIVVLKLNVIKSKTCNLRLVINDENMGTVEGSGTFQQGQQVTVTATPASSKYIFVRWYNEDEDTESTENPYTFTLNSNLTLRAVFRKAPKR